MRGSRGCRCIFSHVVCACARVTGTTCDVRMCACDRYHETTVELGFNYRESFNTFVIQARKGDLPHPSAPSLKRCRLQLGWAAFLFYPNDRRNCAFGGEVPDFTSERTREDGFPILSRSDSRYPVEI